MIGLICFEETKEVVGHCASPTPTPFFQITFPFQFTSQTYIPPKQDVHSVSFNWLLKFVSYLFCFLYEVCVIYLCLFVNYFFLSVSSLYVRFNFVFLFLLLFFVFDRLHRYGWMKRVWR